MHTYQERRKQTDCAFMACEDDVDTINKKKDMLDFRERGLGIYACLRLLSNARNA